MSWDVWIVRAPELRGLDRIPPGFHFEDDGQPEPLGTGSEIRAVLRSVIPDMNMYSDGSGAGSGDGFTVEVFCLEPDDEPVIDFSLCFRGGGDAANVAMMVAELLDAQALSGGDVILTPNTADVAVDDWLRFRDQALARRSSGS